MSDEDELDALVRDITKVPHSKSRTRKLIQHYCERQVVEAQTGLIGWIERNHLGKGFGGSDRWEQCAAEIIDHIKSTLTSKKEQR